jgi:putative MATE family efflux protein
MKRMVLLLALWSSSTSVESLSSRVHFKMTLIPTCSRPARVRLGVVATDADIPLQTPQDAENTLSTNSTFEWGWKKRFQNALPNFRVKGDELDRTILSTAIPSMINLAVVPLVNSVDTFWVGRMGVALALAGQAAANQAFFTIYFLVSFLPTITAPLVAKAVGSGNTEAAQARVCESLVLCNLLGGLGTLLLVAFPRTGLSMILPSNAPTMEYAVPYLRFRALSMIPALTSATGFAAYRGLLNTVTPLKVSLMTNAINLVLDPLFIFSSGMGYAGAALATAIAEATSGLIYLKLLLLRKLARWSLFLRPPSWKALLPLLQGGAAMLFRQAALNIGFLAAGRRAQTMDPSGVSAAAYGIVMQIYTVGIVVHLAMQQTAAALVPLTLCQTGEDDARRVADRMFVWGSIVGSLLGMIQYLCLPFLVPLFSTLPQVQEAVKLPALVASLIHIINGPVFAGEGIMLGLCCYKDLALLTSSGIAAMVLCLLSPLGQRLDGILLSLGAFCSFLSIGVIIHHLRFSPLSKSRKQHAEVMCDVE